MDFIIDKSNPKNALTGITSTLSWGSMIPYLISIFELNAKEDIKGLTIDENGIKVYIKNIKP